MVFVIIKYYILLGSGTYVNMIHNLNLFIIKQGVYKRQ